MRNLRRNPFRSIGIGAAMAVMAGSLLAIAVALQSAGAGVGRGTGRLGADILVVPRPVAQMPASGTGPVSPSRSYTDYALVERLKTLEVIVPQYGGRPPLSTPAVAAASAQLSLLLRDARPAGRSPVRVIGFEPGSDFTVLPWLTRSLRKPLGPAEALVGHRLGQSTGDGIELAGEWLTVVGVLGRSGDEDTDGSIFVPLPTAWKLLQRMGVEPGDRVPVGVTRPITSVLVRARPDAETQRVANFIRSTIPDVEPTVGHVATVALGTQLRSSVRNMLLIAAVIWFTTLLLVGSAFSMVIGERRREIGLLRAMGATRGVVVGLLAEEVLTVCTAGGAVGILVGLGALTAMDSLVRTQPGLWYEWPGAGQMVALGLLCLAVAAATGLLAALVPVLRAATLEPHTAINDGR
jgi:putative ABC transport system permease protein